MSSKNLPKMPFSKNEHSNSRKALENKEKRQVFIPAACIGDPNGIRTRVAALRGPRPRPLDDGTVKTKNVIGYI